MEGVPTTTPGRGPALAADQEAPPRVVGSAESPHGHLSAAESPVRPVSGLFLFHLALLCAGRRD